MLRSALTLAILVLPLPAQPQLGGCPVFPRNHILNTPIDKAPVDSMSYFYVTSIGAAKSLHPDFGPDGAIPFNIVTLGTPKIKVELTGGAVESDPGPYPIPANPRYEPSGDLHMLLLAQENCMLYELYSVARLPGGGWSASSGAIFDLRSNALRPAGWTSADAAGLAILPGLVRYDEIEAGAIRHAIRFTAPVTNRKYIWPARHRASRQNDDNLPPMGLRVRLRAGFDISGFSHANQVILTALKTYGMILADNGGPWFITGAPDPRWSVRDLNQLKRVKGIDFEAVDTSGLMVNPDSAEAKVGRKEP